MRGDGVLGGHRLRERTGCWGRGGTLLARGQGVGGVSSSLQGGRVLGGHPPSCRGVGCWSGGHLPSLRRGWCGGYRPGKGAGQPPPCKGGGLIGWGAPFFLKKSRVLGWRTPLLARGPSPGVRGTLPARGQGVGVGGIPPCKGVGYRPSCRGTGCRGGGDTLLVKGQGTGVGEGTLLARSQGAGVRANTLLPKGQGFWGLRGDTWVFLTHHTHPHPKPGRR